LTALYKKYKDRGLEILAFPCDQFLSQKGDTDTCALKFDAEFPHFAQVDVNGSNAHPLFRYVKDALPDDSWTSIVLGNAIRWNFYKFIFDRDGKPVKRLETKSTLKEMEAVIAPLIDQPAVAAEEKL